MQITRKVRDAVVGVPIQEAPQRVQALVRKIAAVQDVHAYVEEIGKWKKAGIGRVQYNPIRSVRARLRDEDDAPSYGRQIARNEHLTTAYFTVGARVTQRHAVLSAGRGQRQDEEGEDDQVMPSTPLDESSRNHSAGRSPTETTPGNDNEAEEDERGKDIEGIFCEYLPLRQVSKQLDLLTQAFYAIHE